MAIDESPVEPGECGRARSLPFAFRVLRAIFHPRDEWLLFALGLFIFVIGSNTQTGWLYVVDACIAALLVIGWLGPRRTLRGLRVYRDLPPSATEGETVTVRMRLVNTDRRDRYMVTVLDTPAALPMGERKPRRILVPHLPARGSVTLDYPMACPRRGVYVFAPTTLECAAPVGFFPARRAVPSPSSTGIVVYPRALPLHELDVHNVCPRLSTNHHTYHRAGHSFDFHGIREYQPGDDTRYMHWATSARTGRLMVREFRELGAQNLVVLIDTAPGPSAAGSDESATSSLDHAARVAASFVHMAHARSAGIVLMAARGEDVEMLSNARVEAALDWLARLEADASVSWGEALDRGLDRLPRQGRLYILTPSAFPDERALRLLQERRVESSVILLPGCEPKEVEQGLEGYARRGVRVSVMRSPAEAVLP